MIEKLKDLQVQNFRCFKNIEMKFHNRLNLFVGLGKTSILDALEIGMGGTCFEDDDLNIKEDVGFIILNNNNRIIKKRDKNYWRKEFLYYFYNKYITFPPFIEKDALKKLESFMKIKVEELYVLDERYVKNRDGNYFLSKKSQLFKKEKFYLDQLSKTERDLIIIVAGIIYKKENIILIDDLNYSKDIINKFLNGFPDAQFFITTNSPMLISHCKPEHVFVLNKNDYYKPEETYGMDVNRILKCVMDKPSRPQFMQDKINILFELIEREHFQEAKNLIFELKKDIPSDPEIMRAEMLIRNN